MLHCSCSTHARACGKQVDPTPPLLRSRFGSLFACACCARECVWFFLCVCVYFFGGSRGVLDRRVRLAGWLAGSTMCACAIVLVYCTTHKVEPEHERAPSVRTAAAALHERCEIFEISTEIENPFEPFEEIHVSGGSVKRLFSARVALFFV